MAGWVTTKQSKCGTIISHTLKHIMSNLIKTFVFFLSANQNSLFFSPFQIKISILLVITCQLNLTEPKGSGHHVDNYFRNRSDQVQQNK